MGSSRPGQVSVCTAVPVVNILCSNPKSCGIESLRRAAQLMAEAYEGQGLSAISYYSSPKHLEHDAIILILEILG